MWESERQSIAYLFCREILFTRLSPALSQIFRMVWVRWELYAAAKIQAMQSENIHKQTQINESERATQQ